MSGAGETPAAPPAPAAAGSALRGRTLRASAWAISGYLIQNALRFGSNLVLAHVLFPEAFALVALSSIVLQGLEMFSDVGIGAAIVQNPRGEDPAFLNTAFTVRAVRGVGLWACASLLAFPMAALYGQQELRWLIPVGAISCITTGLQSTSIAMLSRKLELRSLMLFGLAESLLKAAITIAWGVFWPSVWALVGGAVISYTLSTIASHTLFPGPRNRFAWDADAVRGLTQFGRWVFVSTTLTFLAQQTDRLLLGSLAPMAVLGVYSISFNLARLPMDVGSQLAAGVLFPALSELVRRDREKLAAKFRESRDVILAAAQFGIVGMIVASPWFFRLLYDKRYAGAALFCPMLAGTIWISILQATADRTLLALGDTRALAFSNFTRLGLTFMGCTIGFVVGEMTGFIVGVGVGNLAGHVVVQVYMARHGVSIVGQDARYTAMIAAFAAVGAGVPRLAGGGGPLEYVLGALVITASGAFTYRRLKPILGELLRKRFART